MKRAMIGLVAALAAAPGAAGGTGGIEKNIVAYEQCILLAAVRVSYTPVAIEQVYPLARAACASARAVALGRYTRQPAMRAAFDAADARTASTLPRLVDNLRERRRLSEALYGALQR